MEITDFTFEKLRLIDTNLICICDKSFWFYIHENLVCKNVKTNETKTIIRRSIALTDGDCFFYFLINCQHSERSNECIHFTMLCVLDSERNDECIDFTMMCVFFFCVTVYSINSRNNAPFSNYGDGF
ncbi:Uncharacterized protein FWK35_00003299 [Aphis craccivora]|uniref:Uncharacterized protein n=1 Tax=Aphis craccivora TaxID=307492 RepID=A0A6G0ZRA0_APHCR|nr:Uncharacterized protein FWK35_00003299 [Aphis craccivora]